MTWILTDDPGEYLAAAGSFLASDAAANTTLLVAAETLRADARVISGRAAAGEPASGGPASGGPASGGPVPGHSVFGGTSPLLGWWQEPGTVIAGAFLHTPPYPVVLTSMAPAIASALAGEIAARDRPLAGVNADQAAGRAFVAAWQQRTGGQSQVRMRSRLYRLGTLKVPQRQPAGRARIAEAADRDLLVDWHAAFYQIEGPGPHHVEPIVDDRLRYGGLTLWEAGGAAVSMAGVTRKVAGHIRVAPVYTPPRHRGNGYAAAVTWAVSQAALDAGARDVVLFTDLANTTSNALYQRLGYRPRADRVVWSFDRPREASVIAGTGPGPADD